MSAIYIYMVAVFMVLSVHIDLSFCEGQCTVNTCCPLSEQAQLIFSKAVQVNYKYVEDLASVWCEWAEMELRNE